MGLSSFSDYVKGKDGANKQPVSPYSEPIADRSICADVEGDDVAAGDLSSPQLSAISQPPLTRTGEKEKAIPEYKKDGMQLKNFTKKESVKSERVISENHDDYPSMKSNTGERFTPAISDLMKYSSHICKNKPVMEKLVREFKRNGTFENLMEEMVNHNELFDSLANHLGHKDHGKRHARRFASALNKHHEDYVKQHFGGFHESVDLPRGGDSSMGGMGMSPMSNPMGTGMGGDQFGMTQPQASQAPSPSMGPASPQPFMAPSQGSSMGPPSAMNQPPTTEGMKVAHHNVLDEMAKFDHQRNYMKECCGGMY